MGLTRIRAGQISDIDYKQSCRVLTTTDITLAGGAPSTVDDINLAKGNRILVTGQSNKAQNGIYVVETLGTGVNGTWVRSTDGNQDGEIEAGMIVMVTEGTVYKDTQWKLTTNDPITLGVSELIFEQNSAFAFGNIYANGTAVLANTVGDTVTFSAGNNIALTANAATKSIDIAVTGISLTSVSNGNSNVSVPSEGGNVTIGVGGIPEVVTFSNSGLAVSNIFTTARVGSDLVPSEDVTYSLGNATHRWANLYLSGNTIYLGNSIITETSDGDIVIENSGGFGVPVGNTAQRTNVQGGIRFNTDLSAFEAYDGIQWNVLALGSISDFPTGDYGDVNTITSDAFGVPLAETFDCASEGPLATQDLGTLG